MKTISFIFMLLFVVCYFLILFLYFIVFYSFFSMQNLLRPCGTIRLIDLFFPISSEYSYTIVLLSRHFPSFFHWEERGGVSLFFLFYHSFPPCTALFSSVATIILCLYPLPITAKNPKGGAPTSPLLIHGSSPQIFQYSQVSLQALPSLQHLFPSPSKFRLPSFGSTRCLSEPKRMVPSLLLAF